MRRGKLRYSPWWGNAVRPRKAHLIEPTVFLSANKHEAMFGMRKKPPVVLVAPEERSRSWRLRPHSELMISAAAQEPLLKPTVLVREEGGQWLCHPSRCMRSTCRQLLQTTEVKRDKFVQLCLS